MKTSACRALRRKLAADQPVFGLWVTLDTPAVTEMAVALGADWVVIDAEHGSLDWADIANHLRATVRSETVALVRIEEQNAALVKRVLDLGADGIVIPWMETAEQLEQAVRFVRYPPEGVRGIGADRATGWGQCLAEHTAEANDHVFVVPMVETVQGGKNLPAMCAVDGVELYFFGTADYSASAGYRGQWEGPGVGDDVRRMKEIVRGAGRHCGVVVTGEDNLRQRVADGYRMIALGLDGPLFVRSLRGMLAAAGRDRPMRADLSVALEPAPPAPPRPAAKRTQPFRVALTRDFHDPDGKPRFRDIGLGLLAGSGVEVDRFADHRTEIGADQLSGVNGVVVLAPRVSAASLAQARDLLAVGRFGVGYDTVDVAACTAADVLLFTAVGAVDRSMAEATVGWMIALTHHFRAKDRLVREARWGEWGRYVGTELRDRTLGLVGCGGIGRAVVRLLAGFGMKSPLAYDPYLSAADAARAGVRPVPLDELLAAADLVSIHCPLTAETRNLIGARELGLMKPSAYLVNTARGGIVDEAALEAALREGRLAGAALDCFATEPLTAPPPVADLDNVLLAPHAIGFTDELFRDIGRAVCRGMLDLSEGRVPRGVINPEVLDRPGFQAKWDRLRG